MNEVEILRALKNAILDLVKEQLDMECKGADYGETVVWFSRFGDIEVRVVDLKLEKEIGGEKDEENEKNGKD